MPDAHERKRLQIGGQAVIEGVMMRSPTCIATAVRTRGGIIVKRESFTSLIKRYRALNIPILRGAVAFIETFVLAVKSLSYSAEVAGAETGDGKKEAPAADTAPEAARTAPAGGGGPDTAEKQPAGRAADETGSVRAADGAGGALSRFTIVATIGAAFLLGFTVFFYIPLVLTELTGLRDGVLFNLVDGVIRLAFLVLYIVLITRWKEMRRIFEYHGAEHKAIAAFETEGAATIANARAYPTMHARCSTSFLLLVVVVSIVIFIALGRPDTIGRKLVRFAFIPVIGGVAYELLKLSARPAARRWFAPLVWPGLALQRLTTAEPDDDQMEVAIAALNACLAEKPVES